MCTLNSQAADPIINQPADIVFELFQQIYESLRAKCRALALIRQEHLTGPTGENTYLNEATMVIVTVLFGADNKKIPKNPCQGLVTKEVADIKKRWKKAYPDQEGQGSQRRLIQRLKSLSEAIRRILADPMFIFALCAIHFVYTYEPRFARTTLHYSNVGEVPVVMAVLERLQTEHARLKKKLPAAAVKGQWFVLDVNATKQWVRLAISKTAEPNADNVPPLVLKSWATLYYNRQYNSPSLCTFNRPFYTFATEAVHVPEGVFTENSPSCVVGPNNCFVAFRYLSAHGMANLEHRGRLVDAHALIESGELLAWMYEEQFQEGPKSDEDDETQPPSKRSKEEHRARVGGKKALAAVQVTEERAHPKKLYECMYIADVDVHQQAYDPYSDYEEVEGDDAVQEESLRSDDDGQDNEDEEDSNDEGDPDGHYQLDRLRKAQANTLACLKQEQAEEMRKAESAQAKVLATCAEACAKVPPRRKQPITWRIVASSSSGTAADKTASQPGKVRLENMNLVAEVV
jgi:hypothetical protein